MLNVPSLPIPLSSPAKVQRVPLSRAEPMSALHTEPTAQDCRHFQETERLRFGALFIRDHSSISMKVTINPEFGN